MGPELGYDARRLFLRPHSGSYLRRFPVADLPPLYAPVRHLFAAGRRARRRKLESLLFSRQSWNPNGGSAHATVM